jgi:hypothetical protein
MAILKGKANAGQGGKIGHSNQDHWEFTEEIKVAARKRRRLQSKTEISAALAELDLTVGTNQIDPDASDEFSQ